MAGCMHVNSSVMSCICMYGMQSAHPTKQYRMVVSMSLGAPGPLTIERMYFRLGFLAVPLNTIVPALNLQLMLERGVIAYSG